MRLHVDQLRVRGQLHFTHDFTIVIARSDDKVARLRPIGGKVARAMLAFREYDPNFRSVGGGSPDRRLVYLKNKVGALGHELG
jgi:hypothetical protein